MDRILKIQKLIHREVNDPDIPEEHYRLYGRILNALSDDIERLKIIHDNEGKEIGKGQRQDFETISLDRDNPQKCISCGSRYDSTGKCPVCYTKPDVDIHKDRLF